MIPQSKVKELEFEGGAEDWSDSWSAKTPQELADHFGRGYDKVVDACSALRIDSPEVKLREVDGTQFYYRQEVVEK